LNEDELDEQMGETSRDHASGRIGWLDYGPEAFTRAQTEKKPILLAISAVWCHWCHVQDRTTYSDPEVIRFVNRDYIPIRVDNDKRPEVNRRYNMGGWPTTAFLTPNGEVMTGGTYIPPDQMKTILREIRQSYLNGKFDTAMRSVEQPREFPVTGVSNEIIDHVLNSVVSNFDRFYGGFGDAPKFPHVEALELALTQYWYSGDRGLFTIATKTLDKMASGGIYDNVGGGFFRYSTTRDWTVPHYEKMCEDNAKLLSLYVHAYQATGREEYRRIATEIIHYVNTTLSDQDAGGFYGSQDADEEYYKLSRNDRTNAKAPFVDRTLYTNWNGLMITAYLEAAPLLDDPKLMPFALKSIDRILAESYDPDGGMMYHYLSGGKPHAKGLLTDQVAFGDALLKAYETTGNEKYLEFAQRLVHYIDGALLDVKNGGYYDFVSRSDSPGYLNRREKPLDENSLACMLLTRIHHATGEEAYYQRAKSTLEILSGQYMRHGSMASTYALAVDLFINEPTRIIIVGESQESGTEQLVKASMRAYDPRKLIIPLGSEADPKRLHSLGYTVESQSRAYICIGKSCLPPLTDPEEITQKLSRHAK
jgi:uncharacterized protein YyaL (SSP411 family)